MPERKVRVVSQGKERHNSRIIKAPFQPNTRKGTEGACLRRPELLGHKRGLKDGESGMGALQGRPPRNVQRGRVG